MVVDLLWFEVSRSRSILGLSDSASFGRERVASSLARRLLASAWLARWRAASAARVAHDGRDRTGDPRDLRLRLDGAV